jgi:hypothetical protein
MEGATGPRAWKINGTYKPSTTELIGGWPVYYRMGQVGKLAMQCGPTTAVTCLAYHVQSNSWLVQSVREMEKRTDKCYARAKCPSLASEIPSLTTDLTGTIKHMFGLENGSEKTKRRSLDRSAFLSAGCLPHRIGLEEDSGTAAGGITRTADDVSISDVSMSDNNSDSASRTESNRKLPKDFGAGNNAESTAVWEVKVGVMITSFEKQPHLKCREVVRAADLVSLMSLIRATVESSIF